MPRLKILIVLHKRRNMEKKTDDRKKKKGKNNRKNLKIMAMFLFLAASAVLVYHISENYGDVEKDFCEELSGELAKHELDCLCSEETNVPEGYEELPIEAICECQCYVNGTWINTVVAIPKNETLNETNISQGVSVLQ